MPSRRSASRASTSSRAGRNKRVWVEAARPKTLVVGLTSVLVGTAAADDFVAWRFVCALIVGLSLQIAVNYANDLFDAVRGVDSPARVGPRRAVASGLVDPKAMKIAVAIAVGVAMISGLALAAAVGPEVLIPGALAILAALAYSGGPKPYASQGLGEVFVFLFFGVVATAGSQYVQDGVLHSLSVLASVPVGILAVTVLMANNMRDIPTDAASGKRTLAVRLGDRHARELFITLVWFAFAALAPVVFGARSGWPLLALASVPLGVAATRTVAIARSPADLVPALVTAARLDLAFGVLLAGGLWLE
jgi:1,4-dihydroxy-2-naphthoate octaprenyltransferase